MVHAPSIREPRGATLINGTIAHGSASTAALGQARRTGHSSHPIGTLSHDLGTAGDVSCHLSSAATAAQSGAT